MPTRGSDMPRSTQDSDSAVPMPNGSNATTPTLGELYQRVSARHGEREHCLGPDVLLDLARGQLDRGTRTDAVRHLADCSDCSKEYRAVQQHPSQEWPLQAAARTEPVRPFNRTLHRWSTVAAAAGLLLTAAIAFWQTRFLADTPHDTGALRSATTALAALTNPEPGASLETPPRSLSWPAQDASSEVATQYRLRLFDSFGEVLLDQTLMGRSSYVLSEEVRETLARGGRFLWTVDAPVQRIGPLWFEVLRSDGQDSQDGRVDTLDAEENLPQ